MGLDIRLEDERGMNLDEVGDPSNLLSRLLPQPGDTDFACLRFVDPYGDTTFNGAQSRALVAELERIRARATTDGERELLERIMRLAQRCHSQPHLYLKFYGD